MPGVCQTCVHFRRVKPPSQLLANVLGHNDASLSQALQKIQEDEIQLRGHEQSFLNHADKCGADTWQARPVMSDYCGWREKEEVFYIAQQKNRALGCNHHEIVAIPKRPCSSCVHRVVSANQDLEREQLYSNQVAGYVAIGKSPSAPEELWKKHRDAVASRKAFEVGGIYATKGRPHALPQYFDYCRMLSSDGEYVVCVLNNTHGTCSHWEATRPETAPAQVAPPPAPATLTQDALATVSDCLDGLSLMLGMVFTPQQLATLRAFAAEAFLNPNSEDAATIQHYAREFRVVAPWGGRQRQEFRNTHHASFVEALGRESDRLSKTLIQWYREATRVIAKGSPPLTLEAAKCAIELHKFAQELAEAREPPPITGVVSEADVSAFGARYPQEPASSQQIIAELPGLVFEMRRNWHTFDTTQRRAVRAQLAAMFGIPLSLAELPLAPNRGQFPEPRIERLRRELREARERGDHQAAQLLYLEIQDCEQANQLTFQRISDQLSRDHQSRMEILKNWRA